MFRFSDIEKKELLKAWIAISFAFSIVLGKGMGSFLALIPLSALTVGLGFLLHEIAHKFVAQRYNCWAEFRADNNMLFMMIIMSFFGFLFAAPGAVMIHGTVTKKRNGIISVAGPLTNFVLAAVFILLYFVTPFKTVASFGAYVNSFIGLFNMLPFWNIDGKKILDWNKAVYGSMVVFGLALMILSFRI